MRELPLLTKMLFKNWMRSRSGVFFSFLFPVMLLLVFGTVFGGQVQVRYELHVQNLDVDPNGKPTGLSRAFITALNSSVLNVRGLDPGLDAHQYMRQQSASFSNVRILVIQRGFHDDLLENSMANAIRINLRALRMILERFGGFMNETQRVELQVAVAQLEGLNRTLTFKPVSIRLLTNPEDRSAPAIRGIIDNIVAKFSERIIGASPMVEVEHEVVEVRALKAVDYYLPGYIAAFTMTNGVIGVTSVVSEYRRNGVLKRLAATPMSKLTWILANMAQQALLALMLMVIMILVGWVVFGVRALPDAYSLALIGLGATMFCGLGALLGGLVKEVEAANALGNAVAFPMMFLSGSFWPLEVMPAYLQQLARLLPLYYFHTGLRQALIAQAPSEAIGPFAILGALAVAFALAAMASTKWKDL